MIIVGFPLIGKSTLANKDPDVLYLESSVFCKGDFDNYLEVIKQLNHPERILMTSAHRQLRERLREHNIPYVFVKPSPKLKDEYIKRSEARQPHVLPTKIVEAQWDAWQEQLPGEVVYELGQGKFIKEAIVYLYSTYLKEKKLRECKH